MQDCVLLNLKPRSFISRLECVSTAVQMEKLCLVHSVHNWCILHLTPEPCWVLLYNSISLNSLVTKVTRNRQYIRIITRMKARRWSVNYRVKYILSYCQWRPVTVHMLMHTPKIPLCSLRLNCPPLPSAVREFTECQMKLKSTYVLSNEQGRKRGTANCTWPLLTIAPAPTKCTLIY